MGTPRGGEERGESNNTLKFEANQREVENSIRITTSARKANVRNKEETLKQPSPKFGFYLGRGAVKVRNQDGGEAETTFSFQDLVELSVVYSFRSMPCMEIRRKNNNRNFSKPMNSRNPVVALHPSAFGRPARGF